MGSLSRGGVPGSLVPPNPSRISPGQGRKRDLSKSMLRAGLSQGPPRVGDVAVLQRSSCQPSSFQVGSSSLPRIIPRVPHLLLLRCNSPTIKFTLLKCMMRWGQYIHKVVQPSPLPNTEQFCHPKKKACAHVPFPMIPATPSPWQSLSTSVSGFTCSRQLV